MMRLIALLLLLAACLAGCGQEPADREEKAVSAILKLGGKVDRPSGRPVVAVDLIQRQITDSLKELKEVEGLQCLALMGTNITDAGLKDLKQALPKTRVIGWPLTARHGS